MHLSGRLMQPNLLYSGPVLRASENLFWNVGSGEIHLMAPNWVLDGTLRLVSEEFDRQNHNRSETELRDSTLKETLEFTFRPFPLLGFALNFPFLSNDGCCSFTLRCRLTLLSLFWIALSLCFEFLKCCVSLAPLKLSALEWRMSKYFVFKRQVCYKNLRVATAPNKMRDLKTCMRAWRASVLS